MQTFHSYGQIGLGDFVSSTSFLFTHNLREDSHIIFHIPKNCGYGSPQIQNYMNTGPSRLTAVLELFENPLHTLTYEFDDSDIVVRGINDTLPYSSGPKVWQAFDHFIKIPNWNQYQFIFRHDTMCTEHLYWPSKKKWEANQNGPIGIYLNHEYQHLEVATKFFNEQDNLFLHSLIDNHNYFSLGQSRTFEENIDVMSKCRYIIGLEGGWTHVSHSMRVPYIICANQRPIKEIKKYHSKHPNLQIIDTKHMRDFLVL